MSMANVTPEEPISMEHIRNVFVDSGHYDLLGCWPMHRLSLNRVITGPILLGESNCNIPVVVQVVAVSA